MTAEECDTKLALWNAINAHAEACGGNVQMIGFGMTEKWLAAVASVDRAIQKIREVAEDAAMLKERKRCHSAILEDGKRGSGTHEENAEYFASLITRQSATAI